MTQVSRSRPASRLVLLPYSSAGAMSTRSATGSLPPPVLDRPTSELAALDAVIANSSDADDDERDAAPFENEPESEEDELFKRERAVGRVYMMTADLATLSQLDVADANAPARASRTLPRWLPARKL